MSLSICHSFRVWHEQHEGPGGVMVWEIFSWHALGPLLKVKNHLNDTAYLSIVAGDVHPFLITSVSTSVTHSATKLKSCQTGVLEIHCTQIASIFTSPLTNLQQLCYASHVTTDQSLKMVSSTLLNLCHEELSEFRGKGGPIWCT